MSLKEYLLKKYPGCEVTRPENIYEEPKELHLVPNWREWECVTITRNPIDRIHSGHQYFTELRSLSVQDMLAGRWKSNANYMNVGFRNPIGQSNYQYFINRFARDHGVKVTNHRFEDLIKDPDFPHINKSEKYVSWTDKDKQYVQEALNKAGIVY